MGRFSLNELKTGRDILDLVERAWSSDKEPFFRENAARFLFFLKSVTMDIQVHGVTTSWADIPLLSL